MIGSETRLLLNDPRQEPLLAEADIGVLHNLAPQSHLILHKGTEFLWRGCTRVDVQLFEAADNVRIAQRRIETGIESLDDRRWRAVWHEDPVPFISFEAG